MPNGIRHPLPGEGFILYVGTLTPLSEIVTQRPGFSSVLSSNVCPRSQTKQSGCFRCVFIKRSIHLGLYKISSSKVMTTSFGDCSITGILYFLCPYISFTHFISSPLFCKSIRSFGNSLVGNCSSANHKITLSGL